ncbi:S1-C subfamily serine protease [Rhodopirellula rubra]|uniref:S1-C subfamily serine protease n=1 Tax=Aporhodopirellula rubra TaxID=980271 RepID=A0A7W5E5P6_9BACT|nr:serine protease [Aporhodopirellula rubra]MBB3210603.1 S1-C subfamily serine protease [Aporhodopirellula rubra]
MKFHLSFLLCVLVSVTQSHADGGDPVDRLDRVACIESRLAGQPKVGKLCSAFFISAGPRLYLVTAGHASADTNGDSRLRYRDAKGESQWVALKILVPPSANPWKRDPTSDLAVAELQLREENKAYLSQLAALAIPMESLCTDTPPRTTAIVTIGFPLGLGVRDGVSPIAVVGHVSSRDTLADNRWGQEPIVLCDPALAEGTSGGPAFLLSDPLDAITVVGMYIGVVRDSSGAKLSKMVPAHLIREFIADLTVNSDGK